MQKSFLFLFLFSSVAWGQGPEVTIPDPIKSVGGVATFLPSDKVKAVDYYGIGEKETNQPVNPALFGGSPNAFIFLTRGIPDGIYRFRGVFSASNGELTVKEFRVQVGSEVAPAPKPKPQPKPKPKPEPKPTPVVTDPDAFFAVVEELDDRTPQRARVLDFTFWDSLGIAGHYRFIDKDTPDMADGSYVAVARDKKLTLPCLIAVNNKGDYLEGIPLPSERSGVADFVKRIRGK